jgi:hypothetical protein
LPLALRQPEEDRKTGKFQARPGRDRRGAAIDL